MALNLILFLLQLNSQYYGECYGMDHSYTVTIPDTQLAAEVLHVTGCSWTSGYYDGYHDVTIIDNYGCQHKFRISSVNIGRSLSIARIS